MLTRHRAVGCTTLALPGSNGPVREERNGKNAAVRRAVKMAQDRSRRTDVLSLVLMVL